MTATSILERHPLFAPYTIEEAENMFARHGCGPVVYPAGAAVLAEGSPADRVGLIISGRVRVEKYDLYGNRNIFVELGEGELFAEAFAFSDVERLSVTVRAVEDSTILLIPREMLLEDHTLLKNTVRLMGCKMFLFDQRIEVISRRRTREKLLLYLQQQSEHFGSDSFVIPFDRQGLADHLGVDRSGLSVEINKLVRQGVIMAEGPWFRLLR